MQHRLKLSAREFLADVDLGELAQPHQEHITDYFSVHSHVDLRWADVYLQVPSESKIWEFVDQVHFRGKSAHDDPRSEREHDAIGWTLFSLEEGAIKEDVTTMAQARELVKTLPWKLGQKEGEKVQCARKAPEPKAWLKVEGVVKPGEVGATRYKPGVFVIRDKGTVEYGTQKAYMHEYFYHGRVFKGRHIFRLLPLGGEMVWLFWRTKDQTPYVLSKRAVKMRHIPDKGISALPKSIRDKVPDEYRYWLKETRAERLRLRDELVEKKILKLSGPPPDDSDLGITYTVLEELSCQDEEGKPKL